MDIRGEFHFEIFFVHRDSKIFFTVEIKIFYVFQESRSDGVWWSYLCLENWWRLWWEHGQVQTEPEIQNISTTCWEDGELLEGAKQWEDTGSIDPNIPQVSTLLDGRMSSIWKLNPTWNLSNHSLLINLNGNSFWKNVYFLAWNSLLRYFRKWKYFMNTTAISI